MDELIHFYSAYSFDFFLESRFPFHISASNFGAPWFAAVDIVVYAMQFVGLR